MDYFHIQIQHSKYYTYLFIKFNILPTVEILLINNIDQIKLHMRLF